MRNPYLSKEMKSIIPFFIVFSLLLVVNLSYARKDMGDYWKNMMNGQPMPEAIKDLLVQDPQVSDARKDHFVRDFDIRPNIILYHKHVVSKRQKQKQKAIVKKLEPDFQGTERHG
ncbi:organ-specific protein S2-like [Abrus precatorius]|uniref:Organ-specific protein S2-like n=1 Tax=Abrus precatorius TaxID=3816 RepID=A0A8B8LJI9_ABRPR|nr:organ-specific protein S2-like [Abrus precatorius]